MNMGGPKSEYSCLEMDAFELQRARSGDKNNYFCDLSCLWLKDPQVVI